MHECHVHLGRILRLFVTEIAQSREDSLFFYKRCVSDYTEKSLQNEVPWMLSPRLHQEREWSLLSHKHPRRQNWKSNQVHSSRERVLLLSMNDTACTKNIIYSLVPHQCPCWKILVIELQSPFEVQHRLLVLWTLSSESWRGPQSEFINQNKGPLRGEQILRLL